MTSGKMVWTVILVSPSGHDDFHIFSTEKRARDFMDEREEAAVCSTYVIDEPALHYVRLS